MKKGYLLAIIFAMLLPLNIHALGTAKMSVSCNTVTINQTSKCTVRVNVSGTSTAGVSGSYSLKGGVASVVSTQLASGWQGDMSGGRFDVYRANNVTGSVTIGTITIKGTKIGTGTISITNPLVGDENNNEIANVNSTSATFKVVAAPTTTKKPTTTTRRPATTTRKRTTTAKRSTTTPKNNTTNRKNTTTAKDGSIAEKTTANQHIVAQDPLTPPSVAQEIITTEVPLELTSIKVDDFNVIYNNGAYYVTVNSDTEFVTVSATAGEGIAVYGTGKRNLTDGKNLVQLVLTRTSTSESKTVDVVITKPDASGVYDTTLKDLSVVGYKLEFKPGVYEYTIKVPYSTKEVYILAVPNDENVNIIGDGTKKLSAKDDVAYINVSYGDLATTQYVINIKKTYNSLLLLVFTITLGGGVIGLSIYNYINKQKAAKLLKAEKNRQTATNNRLANNSQIEVNGKKVVDTGVGVAVPKKVIPISTQKVVKKVQTSVNTNNGNESNINNNTQPQIITNAPAPQVKVVKKKVVIPQTVKTINTETNNIENNIPN